MAIAKILVDFNLVVRYGIAIRIYTSKKSWWILIWQLQRQAAKLPNCQLFQLYGNTRNSEIILL